MRLAILVRPLDYSQLFKCISKVVIDSTKFTFLPPIKNRINSSRVLKFEALKSEISNCAGIQKFAEFLNPMNDSDF